MNAGTLTREVPQANRSMFGKLIGGAFVVGVLASSHLVPRTTIGCHGDSKVDRAHLVVQRFAHEAAPQWQHTYRDGCPHSAYELTEFLEGVKAQDPWGSRYQILCTHNRVIVVSTGADRLSNTTDDIRSDQ